MEYLNVKQVSEQWNLSDRRVRVLCNEGKIDGVIKKGRSYLIPVKALKPIDWRTLRGTIIPPEYTMLFARVESLKAELDRRPLTQGELKRLQKEFLVEFTYNSNAIEGNTLTLRETALVLEGVTIDKKPLKEHLEIVGHRDAFLYVQQLVSEKATVTEKVIKEIHSLVLIDRPQDKGIYRSIPVRIMGAHNEPLQPYFIPIQMERLIARQMQEKRHIIEKAALFHLDIEGIHPFVDGNGRTGRLILNLMLMQHGYPPINVKFADRRRYYDCFESYCKNKTAAPMVEMLSAYLEEQLRQYLEILK